MGRFMRANGKTTRWTVKALSFGRMELTTPVTGNAVRCTAKENSDGQILTSTKENSKKTKKMESEFSFGKTDANTPVNGRMVSNMEWE
jgi:hypothetical protein